MPWLLVVAYILCDLSALKVGGVDVVGQRTEVLEVLHVLEKLDQVVHQLEARLIALLVVGADDALVGILLAVNDEHVFGSFLNEIRHGIVGLFPCFC